MISLNYILSLALIKCWYLRLTNPHIVINSGKNHRANLTIDMIPFN